MWIKWDKDEPHYDVVAGPDIAPTVRSHREEAAHKGAAEALRAVASFLENEIAAGKQPSEVAGELRELAETLDPDHQ